jgi:hypothetical protein
METQIQRPQRWGRWTIQAGDHVMTTQNEEKMKESFFTVVYDNSYGFHFSSLIHHPNFYEGDGGNVLAKLVKSQKREAELQEKYETALAMIKDLSGQLAKYKESMDKIIQWSKAYPLSVFPEPDFKKAAQILKDSGMTLDAISASNMRHVLKGVIEIAGSVAHPDNAKD